MEAAEGRFLGGGDARPVHNTVQYPFQDVMAQCGMCSEGRAPHPMVDIGRAEGRATVALHSRGVGGQHADAKAVAEASVDFPMLGLKGPGEGERVEPGRGWTASAVKRARPSAFPVLYADIKGL
jgi:hypothetical protein